MFSANCNCGTKVMCTLSRFNEEDDVYASFQIELGDMQSCGPSYLRLGERNKVIKEIEGCGSIEQYRAQKAREFMKSGDPQPAIIRSTNVLHTAQSTGKRDLYLHPDPIVALDIMKFNKHSGIIKDIQYSPFSAVYITKEQITGYKIASQTNVSLCMDITGLSKVFPIKRPYSSKLHDLFLLIFW